MACLADLILFRSIGTIGRIDSFGTSQFNFFGYCPTLVRVLFGSCSGLLRDIFGSSAGHLRVGPGDEAEMGRRWGEDEPFETVFNHFTAERMS